MFGLEEATLSELAQKIEVVFHCGAAVNTVAPYSGIISLLPPFPPNLATSSEEG
jgi:hypothetical protein